MDPVWIVIALAAAGFAGAGFIFSKERLPPFLRDIFLTGWEFFIVGALAGPAGFHLLGPQDIAGLDPFIALVLGWAGLIFGIQLRLSDLNKIDPAMKALTLGQAGISGVGIGALFALFIIAFEPLTPAQVVAPAIIVAAAGAISSPTAISLVAARHSVNTAPITRPWLVIATLDVGPAIVILGLVFLFFPPSEAARFGFSRGMILLFYSFLIAGALAMLFKVISRSKLSTTENQTVLFGFVIFISGAAFYLNLSPLFLSLVTGVFLANTLRHDDGIYPALHSVEKPFYIILLILAGLWWYPASGSVWFAAAILVAARLWLKNSSYKALSQKLALPHEPGKGAGLALGAQGALALAIGLNFVLIYPGPGPKLAFDIICIMTLVNEILAPWLVNRAIQSQQ